MFHRWLSSGCVLTWGKDTDPIQGASTLKTYLALRGSTSKHDHIECQVWTWIWDGVGGGGAHKCSVYSSPAWPWHVGPMWTRGCPSRCAGLCCPLSWGKEKQKPSVWEVLLLLWDCSCLVESKLRYDFLTITLYFDRRRTWNLNEPLVNSYPTKLKIEKSPLVFVSFVKIQFCITWLAWNRGYYPTAPTHFPL